MRVFVVCTFLYLAFLFFGTIRDDINNERETNVTFTEYTVKSLGQCKNDICSFIAEGKDGGSVAGMSTEPVSVGATVYKKCWSSIAEGDTCGNNFSTKPPEA